MQEKKEIRKYYLNKRSLLTEAEVLNKSLSITKGIKKLSQYKEAELVYIYMDFKNEVKTEYIIKDAFSKGKRIAVPKIEDDIMNFYYIDSLNELKAGYFGILEPITSKIVTTNKSVQFEEANGIVIVPGVAFCENGYRIGYGKGFYDRYLSKNNRLTKAAICFEGQIADPFYHDSFDVKMDFIVTESRIIKV